jgi:hypothetical protein
MAHAATRHSSMAATRRPGSVVGAAATSSEVKVRAALGRVSLTVGLRF